MISYTPFQSNGRAAVSGPPTTSQTAASLQQHKIAAGHSGPISNPIAMDTVNPLMLRKLLARNMRIRRAELDISQEEVALRTGLTQAYLSGIEREKRNISLDTIQKIAFALETTGSALLNIH